MTSLLKPISVQDLRNALLRALASAAGRTAPSALAAPAAPATIAALGLRILLAEDNPVNQKIAVRMLEKRGHTVEVVSNGLEALARLEQTSFDLLLTDMQMPGMDGFELTAAIRAGEGKTGAHLPIVAMTALAMKGDQERCLAAGMDGYISKPMRANELFEVVERFLPAHANS
jgi:CheY-like chemotaxis protein